jgi:uncharacterized membrane protein (DUF4010 family)
MNPPIPGDPLIRFVAALLLGALVGLEREFSSRDHEGSIPFAGIRTFPIISALGFAAALASQYVTWSFAVAFLTIGALSVTAYWRRSVRETDAGATTQITALVVFLLGGLCYWGELPIAATTGVVLTLLLSYKPALHKAVRVLEAEDIHALLKFALISAVILPALPNQDIGPGGVFNPRIIWLMVVFVSAVSFAGYGFTKFFGERAGIATTGLLGGLASSTAATFSFSRLAQEHPEHAGSYGGAVAMATTILYPRVFLIVLVWAPALAQVMWIPLLLLFVGGVGITIWLWRTKSEPESSTVSLKNPFELGPALKFGAIFALILMASRGAYEILGSEGIYLTSFLAGLEGLDAITLTLGRLVPDTIASELAIRGVMLAVIANTVVKAGISWGSKSPVFIRRLFPFFGLQILLALGVILLI